MTRARKAKAEAKGKAEPKDARKRTAPGTLKEVPRTPSYDVSEPRMAVDGTYVAIAFVAILAGSIPIVAENVGVVAAATPLFLAGIVLLLLALLRPRGGA